MNQSLTRCVAPFALTLSLVSLAACSLGPSLRQQMVHATASPNPMTAGRLVGTPIAVTREGGMLRIIVADDKEVCVNGEINGDPEDVGKYGFRMMSFQTPDDDESKATSSPSKSVKVLGSYKRMGRGGAEPLTQFQTCFDNGGVFAGQTSYLVIKRDPLPPLAPPVVAVWHFDDSIRQMSAQR